MYNFPDQTIPESKKDEQWHKQHILDFVDFAKSETFDDDSKEVEKLYYAYLAKIHPDEENIIKKTITQRYCDSDLGPQYDIYPLIENTLEQLIGDYRLRPLKLYALTQNPDAVIAKLDEMYDAYIEKLTRKAHEEIKEEEGIEIPTENPDMEVPGDDDPDFFKNYRTKSEQNTESVLYFLLVVKKEKEKIYQLLLHYLICGRVNAVMIEKDGHPSIAIGHPLLSSCDTDPNNIIQDNPQHFYYTEPMAINDIYNTYDLKKSDKAIVNGYTSITSEGFRGKIDNFWFKKSGNDSKLRVNVVTLIWKSRIRKRFKRRMVDGREEMIVLPDDYRRRKKDDIVNVDLENIRHCTMIGPDLVLEYGVQEDQLKAIGNDKKKFINVVGINNNNSTGSSTIRSVTKKIKFLQDYSSEILYEIKLAMRQIDGGVLVYDLSNIPKEWMALGMNNAIEKVNYSIKKDRVMYINSADKKSNGYASAVNISQKSRIGELTSLLALIEQLAEKISGVNGAKNGNQADYAKATVAQMNMLQASARIENIYGPFDTFIEKFLERIVLKAQHIYKKSQILNYYQGDGALKFMEVKEEFFDDDLGITLSDPRKEMQAKEMINNAVSQMLLNTQDPKMILELIKIHMNDSASDSIAILEKGIAAMDKAMKEREAAAAEQQQAMAEQQAAREAKEDQKDADQLQNNIDVANIYATNKLQTDQTKEENANLRKAAEIESRQQIEDGKQQTQREKQSDTVKSK